MLRVTELTEIKPYYIVCHLNNGEKRRLDILPILQQNSQIVGIERLTENSVFQSAHIGVMGEVCWENIIRINNEIWNFDISPEFIFYNGIKVAD